MDEICKNILIRGVEKMSGKITGFFREFIMVFSIILTVLGIFILFIGITGFLEGHPMNFLNLSEEFFNWSLYLLIIGFILLITGLWYLYSFFSNRKFIIDELKTNKRSEFLKMHSEIKSTAKHLPKKYKKMVKDKEQELKIK